MREVVPAPVAVAGPAEVADVDRVRLEIADGVGADQEAVLVELERRRVVVVVQADLGRVAGKDEILAVVIGEEQVLAAVVERVERGVGVFFPLTEVDQVELVAIREPGAEEPDAAVDVGEQETRGNRC